jgi:hypothetical protein
MVLAVAVFDLGGAPSLDLEESHKGALRRSFTVASPAELRAEFFSLVDRRESEMPIAALFSISSRWREIPIGAKQLLFSS